MLGENNNSAEDRKKKKHTNTDNTAHKTTEKTERNLTNKYITVRNNNIGRIRLTNVLVIKTVGFATVGKT